MSDPTASTGNKAYTRWNIQTKLLDGDNNEIDAINAVQELYIGPDAFVVRVTRDMDGTQARYEDRGTLDAEGAIKGKSGFGGQLTGIVFKDSFGVLSQGTGGDVEFILGAVSITPEHNRCFRRFEVRKATTIFGTKVEPGVYYTTSNDYLAGSAAEMPAELKAELAAGNS